MRAQEITTASGQDILDYVKSIHHDFRLDSEILDHPQWHLSHVPLGQLHIPDPESGEDESDPYDRVQWMDMAHVDDIKQRDIDNKPIVIDTNGYILDGNHRALAARLSGRQTIPAWVPVPDLDESVLRLKQDQQAQEFIDRVYELYPLTWQNNHVMTWGEGEDQELAMFELVPNPARPRTVEVKWFQAYPLRRGIGSRAMRELQRLALEAGVDLSLYVWDKGQVSAAKLARFYRAQGFRPTAKGSRSMTWSPVNETVPGLKFLRPGELRGSYTNAQLQALGFRQARNGAWFIPQRRWQELTQSGQLREQQLQERVSSIIYHYTNILAGLQAVKSGQFELSSVLGSEWEQQFAPRGYPYFFSATRTRTGGYHDYVGDTAVMFVLDGDWFNSRYPGGSVDYWGNRDPKQSSHRAHEAEDRIFSRERSIPTGGVRAVHVLAKPDADPQHRAWARQLIIAAKQQNLPVYLYNDAGAWRALDTRKTVKPNYLTGQDAARGRGTRGHRGYLMPWMELIWGRDRSSLSKRAQSVLYNLNYHYDRGESVKILGVDLSNARKPSSGPDRENAVKIISYMRKNRLADLAALAEHIRGRWKSLEPVREDIDQKQIQRAAIDFYQRNTSEASEPVENYVQQARELISQADGGIRDRVREVLARARKNPYIQGGVITAVGALLAGAALTSAQRMGLSPTQTNMLLQALLNTVIPTMVSRVNGRDWRDTIKYTLASMGVGTGIAALTEKTAAPNHTVTRIDSKPINDFAQNMQTYYHSKDFSMSGQFPKDAKIPKEYSGKMTGVYAGDPLFTAPYATGNANQTRYVAQYGPGQPILYFDRKDIPAMRNRRTYLTVFDASRFAKLPTGEYFSSDPGDPLKQQEITDPLQHIQDQGWTVRVVDDLSAVLAKIKKAAAQDQSVKYGAEGMNESMQENFADGKKPGSAVVQAILGVLPTAQEIWFHGSRAIGKHRPDSDTDILVIVPGQFDAEEYFNAVRTLQSLNEKFHNYDIQPSKPGSNIHRIAQEEGKLLWRATNENFTFDQPRRALNIPELIKRGAIFITHPHGPQGWETDRPDWDFSLITLQNVLQKSPDWVADYKKYIRPQSFKQATPAWFSKLSDQKYNQILWSIQKLGIPDNVAFLDQDVNENFADGKKPGRRGLAKRMGVPTKASVSKLRKIAQSSSGEKQRMAHWLANMKSGRARKNK